MVDLYDAIKAIEKYINNYDYYVKVSDEAVTFINKSDGIDLVRIERNKK